MKNVVAAAALALIAVGPVAAQIGINLGPQVGQFGVGGSVQVMLMEGLVSVSGEAGYLPWKEITRTIENVDFTIEPDLLGGLVLFNLHPLRNGFSVGVGAMIGGYDVDGIAVPSGDTFELNGVNYPADEVGSLTGHFELSGNYPAAMVGFRGRGFNLGVGVALTDTPLIELEADGAISNDADFVADLEAERQKVEDWFDLGLFPLFRLGIQFGF